VARLTGHQVTNKAGHRVAYDSNRGMARQGRDWSRPLNRRSKRSVALILLSVALSSSGAALAQSGPPVAKSADATRQREASEEVVARGRRIGELRARIEPV
jgi:hypothetical protein